MNSFHTPAVVRVAAAVASVVLTLTALTAVVSLSEPQHSRLMAATASRQIATAGKGLLVAQSKQVQQGPAAEATITAR